MVNYSLSPREIQSAEPTGLFKGSGYILQYSTTYNPVEQTEQPPTECAGSKVSITWDRTNVRLMSG